MIRNYSKWSSEGFYRCDICGRKIKDDDMVILIAEFPFVGDDINPTWWNLIHSDCYYEIKREEG